VLDVRTGRTRIQSLELWIVSVRDNRQALVFSVPFGAEEHGLDWRC
jgi:hypothetical protein